MHAADDGAGEDVRGASGDGAEDMRAGEGAKDARAADDGAAGSAQSADDLHSRDYVIRGRVQGVGFRWWTRGVARRLGIAGSVRNRADGSVEVVATAAPRRLAEFEDALRAGPPGARVDEIDISGGSETVPAPADRAGASFEILR